MKLYGRNIGLLFSVGAKFKIGSIDKEESDFMRTVKSVVILSEAYETARSLREDEYKKTPLTEDEVLSLTDKEFADLCEEIAKAYEEGNKTTVEAAKGKKKEKTST